MFVRLRRRLLIVSCLLVVFGIIGLHTSKASAITPVPSLDSPLTGNTYALVPINFNLPTAPGAGTVRLIFSGPTTKTITLSTSAAGTTSFNLNRLNIAASGSVIQSVSPAGNTLADGTYSVTLAYQNAAFDPAATATVSNVIIDTSAGGISIASLSPINNASNVSTSPILQLTFNQPMSTGSGNIILHKGADNSVVENIDVTGPRVSGNGTRTFAITPDVVLAPNTSYYITFASGVFTNQVAAAFAGISSPATWQFTTAASGTSPAGTSIVPVPRSPQTGFGQPSHKPNPILILVLTLFSTASLLYLARQSVIARSL
jgi:hypothetical protein